MATDKFVQRHNGPRQEEVEKMLRKIGAHSLDALIDETVPKSIRLQQAPDLAEGISEYEYLCRLREIASKNKLYKSYIGTGYYDTILPPVIQRNILENPAWYTSYTPYQAEISQGRLEALINFQTVIMELTGMEIANASLLDEATAAAEAMIMMYNCRSRNAVKAGANILFADENIFPQTLDVIKTRSAPLGIELVIGKYADVQFSGNIFGAIVQYPNSDGNIENYRGFTAKAHESEVMVAVAADLMSLVLLTPPGEWGADIVVGSAQRFGIPMGFGGPHAGFFASLDKFKRTLPGRIIGVTVDVTGKKALRLSLQTREQHIKRERATSNICTAQALLATMAGMYAVYHGAEGLQRIARHIHGMAGFVHTELCNLGYTQENKDFFDTLKIKLPGSLKSTDIEPIALKNKINLRYFDEKHIGISVDETVMPYDAVLLVSVFAQALNKQVPVPGIIEKIYFGNEFSRKSGFLGHNVFKANRCESEMMRYIKKLERKDISLTHSMISLGSCTMKLNAASEMLALSWPEFGGLHPFVPKNQAEGYYLLMDELSKDLCLITGFDAVSFQPNSGAAGEYAGLMVIRKYHIGQGNPRRNVAIIPASAHGTNPASAAMAGMQVVVVDCDEKGNISIDDLRTKAAAHKERLSCFMVTYPSTHGVFEGGIKEMTRVIHDNGGLVYMDGANMNAQVGLTNPASIGADVCHLNLHKTFAIPHGGGGPGAGPICVTKELAPYLPSHPVTSTGCEKGIHAVAAAPFGSAMILTISHAYIKMMGKSGLTEATKYAILNSNYLASALKNHYDVLYTGETGRVAHEMILDCRKFKHDPDTDISEADIAKRLMDYGFHAPTLSFPVHGTLMIEPTESESLQELDRFVEALIHIRKEIDEVTAGIADKKDNVLKNAPHVQETVISDTWTHAYGREKAAFPLKWIADNKFWPGCSRVDDAYGDRNLVCSCAPIDEYRAEIYR